jgi:hypothetical protein
MTLVRGQYPVSWRDTEGNPRTTPRDQTVILTPDEQAALVREIIKDFGLIVPMETLHAIEYGSELDETEAGDE